MNSTILHYLVGGICGLILGITLSIFSYQHVVKKKIDKYMNELEKDIEGLGPYRKWKGGKC